MQPSIIHSETELVSLLKSKNQAAFSYLYDNYAAALNGVIIKVLGEDESSKDLLQEVFIKIWKHIDSYDATKGRLYTWMLNIARNSAIDILRSTKHNQNKKISNLENSVHSDGVLHATSIKTEHIGLKKIVSSLKEEYRQIIDLAYFKGYTQDEIAKELNIPVGTVKTRSRNALMQLKTIMR